MTAHIDRERLQAFLADLTALTKQHGLAIVRGIGWEGEEIAPIVEPVKPDYAFDCAYDVELCTNQHVPDPHYQLTFFSSDEMRAKRWCDARHVEFDGFEKRQDRMGIRHNRLILRIDGKMYRIRDWTESSDMSKAVHF